MCAIRADFGLRKHLNDSLLGIGRFDAIDAMGFL